MKKFSSVGNLKSINVIALVLRKQTYSFSRDSKNVELGIEQKAPDTAVSIDERMNPLKTKMPEGNSPDISDPARESLSSGREIAHAVIPAREVAEKHFAKSLNKRARIPRDFQAMKAELAETGT